MIPKIIHYTWFSGDKMPELIENCIESWRKILPDYELRLWDFDSIKHIKSVFLNEALSVRKWAYAADYVRLYALYNEGGIYLDTDVFLFKNFDPFLSDDAFIGKEDSMHFNNDGYMGAQYLTSHCMGAIKGHPFIKQCLDYYENRHYILSNNEELPRLLRFHYVLLPYIQAVIAKEYGYNWDPRCQQVQRCSDGLIVYPYYYFCGNSFAKESFCQHLALGGWREAQETGNYTTSIKRRLRFYFIRSIRRFFMKHSLALVKIDNFD